MRDPATAERHHADAGHRRRQSADLLFSGLVGVFRSFLLADPAPADPADPADPTEEGAEDDAAVAAAWPSLSAPPSSCLTLRLLPPVEDACDPSSVKSVSSVEVVFESGSANSFACSRARL